MDYIAQNKAAWEEAFDERDKEWGSDILNRLDSETFPFFQPEMVALLNRYNLEGQTVAQFCCNNGRELLSLVKYGKAVKGYGFDIAENQITFASTKAAESSINCEFSAVNILDIGKEYHNRFDFILVTVGALCWFKNIEDFFRTVSLCLRKKGVLVINEMHPVTNMLAVSGEENYNSSDPAKLLNSYFEKEWIENDGIYYITRKIYQSKTFKSYTHSLMEIINGICSTGLKILRLEEFDIDISGLFSHLDNKAIPLSFILEAEK